MNAPVDLNRVDGALNAEDYIPGLYPLRVGAIAAINRALADMPFFATKQAIAAINAPELKTGGENRADSQLDMAASILTPSVDEIGHDAPIASDDAPQAVTADVSAEIEASAFVMSNGVGGASAVGESEFNQIRKPSTSKHGRKRNPKAVQIVLDYLMTHPADARLSTNALTDKLKYDVRIKVGRSSVGKALGVIRANGQR